jgi:hypothetical protein
MFFICFLLFWMEGIGGKSGDPDGWSERAGRAVLCENPVWERVSFRENQSEIILLNSHYVISVTDCKRKENVLFVGSVTPRTECGEPRKSF